MQSSASPFPKPRNSATISHAAKRNSSTSSLAPRALQEQTGTHACSSTTAKIPQPALQQDPPSRISFATVQCPAEKPSSSSKVSRCFAQAACTSPQNSSATKSPMCSSGDAPFLLQWDAFSCRDALDFNRAVTRIPSIDALLQKTVDAQELIFALFAQTSPLPSPSTLHTLGKRRR